MSFTLRDDDSRAQVYHAVEELSMEVRASDCVYSLPENSTDLSFRQAANAGFVSCWKSGILACSCSGCDVRPAPRRRPQSAPSWENAIFEGSYEIRLF